MALTSTNTSGRQDLHLNVGAIAGSQKGLSFSSKIPLTLHRFARPCWALHGGPIYRVGSAPTSRRVPT